MPRDPKKGRAAMTGPPFFVLAFTCTFHCFSV